MTWRRRRAPRPFATPGLLSESLRAVCAGLEVGCSPKRWGRNAAAGSDAIVGPDRAGVDARARAVYCVTNVDVLKDRGRLAPPGGAQWKTR